MAKWVRPTTCRPVRRPTARRLTVTGTVIASDGSPARSGRSRSPCRGRGSVVRTGRDASGRARGCPDTARMTRQVEALIAGTYLAGTNTRRVRRARAALFKGAIGKDAVSRIWRKVKTDWEAWSKRPLAEEDIVRLILDGTVVRVRLDKKATSISLLVVLGVRRDGQKVLLAVKNMFYDCEAMSGLGSISC